MTYAELIAAIADRVRVARGSGPWSTENLPGKDVVDAHEIVSLVEAYRSALAAPPAGPEPGDPPEDGIDLDSCGGCGDPCIVWRGSRKLYANDPCAWLVDDDPRIGKSWVFDCKNQDPREDAPAPVSTEKEST